MIISIGALFVVVFILIIVQIYFALFYKEKTNDNDEIYCSEITKHGDTAMVAVDDGKIKMHILINDAKTFDGKIARKTYAEFINNSALSRKIVDFRGTRYNG